MASVAYSSPMSGPYVEVKVAAVDLKFRHSASRKMDTFAVLLRPIQSDSRVKNDHSANAHIWEELARTEIVRADSAPAFVESFEIPLSRSNHSRSAQDSTFVIAIYYKTASCSEDLRKNSLLGYIEFKLKELLKQEHGILELQIQRKSHAVRSDRTRAQAASQNHGVFFHHQCGLFSSSDSSYSQRSSESTGSTALRNVDSRLGKVILCGELIIPERPAHMYSFRLGLARSSGAWGPLFAQSRGRPHFHCNRENSQSKALGVTFLRKKSSSELPGLFYVLYRAIPGSSTVYTPVYQSELLYYNRIANTEASFQPAQIRVERLLGMHEHRPLRIVFFHHNSLCGMNSAIGYIQTSITSFKYAKPQGLIYINPNRDSGLVRAKVIFDGAAIAVETVRATLSSVIQMQATGFVWGLPTGQTVESTLYDADVVGRMPHEVNPTGNGSDCPQIHRGVSHMSLIASRIGSSIHSDDTESKSWG